MEQGKSLKLFEQKKIRSHWDAEQEKWYFAVMDVVWALTESEDPRKYWSVLKTRLRKEGSELTTICSQLKMIAADGKSYLTDTMDIEQIFRLIQSIPSKKAEPFKLWLAQVGRERLEEIADPEMTIDRALETYLAKGYSPGWINQRLKSIEVRKALTDEWEKRGVEKGPEFAILTDIITKAWAGKTTQQYKELKGLKKENLRDNMTNVELILNMLAEASTTEISAVEEPQTFAQNAAVAKKGGNVARAARTQLEQSTGTTAVTAHNAGEILQPRLCRKKK